MALTQKKAKRDEKKCLILPGMSNKWEPITKPRYQAANQQQLIDERIQCKERVRADLSCRHRLNKPLAERQQGPYLAEDWHP